MVCCTWDGLYSSSSYVNYWQRVALDGQKLAALAAPGDAAADLYALTAEGAVPRREGATLPDEYKYPGI